ncbi:MAG: aspartate/glutamate racemase family protein [Spirochaetia bacterium]|nr:aspartate/glutamate racemase family protein [Spirochaetia bacterium]
MKTAGLIGGMSWESTLEYYRIINEEVKKELGGSHSAKCLIYSFDFDEVEKLQHNNEWEKLTSLMVNKANDLKNAGADFIAICTNTMHLMASDIEKGTNLKVVHIAEATAKAAIKKNVKKVLLLGTKFTMEGTFYKTILNDNNIEVLIPNTEDRQFIHNVIYNELVRGIIKEESKTKYISIINKFKKQGIEGVVLGCTEIPLLIKQKDLDIEVFDTTEIHSIAIAKFALNS